MFPFHTWLPDAHTEAPTAGSVILAGVLLKMGTYGFIRFSLPLLPVDPAARHKIITIMLVVSIIGILYGALVCMMQKDMKKLIAYSSVSHLGFCTLGIFALTPNGLSGSVIQQINHGLSTGALFLIIGVLYERRHTRLISEFGGLSTPMPNFAAIYMIASLSSLGLPLLNGFIGEFTILRGVYEVNIKYVAWAVIGIVLGAAYLLWLYQRVMFGPVTNPANEHLEDLNLREYATLVPLIILCFWIGIYPKPLFRVLERPVQLIVEQATPGYYAAHGIMFCRPRQRAEPGAGCRMPLSRMACRNGHAGTPCLLPQRRKSRRADEPHPQRVPDIHAAGRRRVAPAGDDARPFRHGHPAHRLSAGGSRQILQRADGHAGRDFQRHLLVAVAPGGGERNGHRIQQLPDRRSVLPLFRDHFPDCDCVCDRAFGALLASRG